MPLVSIAPQFDEVISRTSSRRTFLGTADTAYDEGETIKQDPLTPREGDEDKWNPLKRITDVQVERAANDNFSLFWKIVVTSTFQDVNYDNPLNKRAVITLESDEYDGYTCFNGDGECEFNTAGDILYFPVESSRWVFNVKKNVVSIPQGVLQYNNTINNGDIVVRGLPCPKRTLMCKKMRGGEDVEVNVGGIVITYLPLTFQLHYKKEGWDISHPNVGYNQIVVVDEPEMDEFVVGRVKVQKNGKILYVQKKVKRRITVGYPPELPSEPQVLDENGKWVRNPTANDVITKKIKAYRELDFTQLPLQ